MIKVSVPLCPDCWREWAPGLPPQPVRSYHRSTEACYRCKKATRAGLYLRIEVEPQTVKKETGGNA